MEEYAQNSANHQVDPESTIGKIVTWYREVEGGVEVREREYHLYLAGECYNGVEIDGEQVETTNLKPDSKECDEWFFVPFTLHEVLNVYDRQFNVEYWKDAPNLLNEFVCIPFTIRELEAIRKGAINTTLHQKVSEVISTIGGPVFVRTESASPKDMLHLNHSMGEQARPLKTAQEILYAIATSRRCLEAIEAGIDNHLYIAPWVDLSDHHHFRVFIHQNKVRAISQYDLLEPPSEEEIPHIREKIIDLWKTIFMKSGVFYEDCCMDVVYRSPSNDCSGDPAVVTDNHLMIVEFNQFGVTSRAGSALYNWIQDFHTLYYGEGDVRLNKSYV